MKKYLLVIFILLLSFSSSFSQFKEGHVELGFDLSLGSERYETTYFHSNYSNSKMYLLLSVMPGIYLTDGFSIEPEIGASILESIEPIFLLIGNVSYTFSIPKNTVHPFVKIGYGISNGIGFQNQYVLSQISRDVDVGVFNMGAGIKNVIGKSTILRMELNYRRFSYTQGSSTSSNSLISLVMGVGFLL